MDFKLPKVVSGLLTAQNNYDSDAYAGCFSETALVINEEKVYKGKKTIKDWIEKANQQFKIKMKPTKYSGSNSTAILTAVVSGNFNGSPVALNYHMEIKDNEITRLEITASNAE
ncbi:nuclear transport factor 2 family protein [uncultured Bacteroides sp.]|uniref:nuclear transport factor 2 family protein n=1 Tax=uncultured Bacteroides sp. TaxID=162156 RepID=UPI002AAB7816|nr:nuclear transport factor 2 family protein [uncultured Bacteroides sp.]